MQPQRYLSSLMCVILATPTFAAFQGLGKKAYDPVCATACRAPISGAQLKCSGTGYGGIHSHGAPPTTPPCRAQDESFLLTLAYCISTKCDLPIWRLETYWALETTGSPAAIPKWTYTEALQHVGIPPNVTYAWGTELNQTSLISSTAWQTQFKFMDTFEWVGTLEARYSIVILIVGFATPVVITILGKLPFARTIIDRLNPYIIWPSTIGTYQVRPLPWLLGNVPTLGQTLYIVGFFLLNVVLSIVGYESSQPHPWGYDKTGEVLAYAGYRTGHIAFALLPLVVLLSGRNNILLWLTNWSHSTYMLLHRWVARIFAIQTIMHSVLLLAAYTRAGILSENEHELYWKWGIVVTVFTCAMIPLSFLWFRRISYEIFLIVHIILAIFVVVGCWYHLYYRFGLPGSYEYWLYATAAVWFFDRLMRVGRIGRNGIRKATVTEVGDAHVRVDVEGVRWAAKPGHHAYAYFPTLSPGRPWENHPFSINSTALFRSNEVIIPASINDRSSTENQDVEKSASRQVTEVPIKMSPGNTGVTFFIRKNTGLTRLLRNNANLLTLIDGPYANNQTDDILKCDRVLLIGGGIGITGLLGWLHAHHNVKLAWSIKSSDEAVAVHLEGVLRDVEKEVLIGQRVDAGVLLEQEVRAGWKRIGVVVCGPGGLCDDVRAEVVRIGRKESVVFELEVDAFSW